MRIESSVTSVSWIPSEAIDVPSLRLPFDRGVLHYDDPLPDAIDDLDRLLRDDRFRFANELRAWVDAEDGRILDHGHTGRGLINRSTFRLASREIAFQPTPLEDLRSTEPGADRVRFVQTVGGRTGLPAPRRVRHAPFVQLVAPTVWTTLSLTIAADGSTSGELIGASPFPRHWIYDGSGGLVQKSGLLDFTNWYRSAFGRHTPWGDEDSPAFVAEVESALERELSRAIMRGDKQPRIVTLQERDVLVEQGAEGVDLFLLLDGVLRVEVDGEDIAEVGPGAVLGERALLETGRRTSTLRADTRCRVAVVPGDAVDRAKLEELLRGHRREEEPEG